MLAPYPQRLNLNYKEIFALLHEDTHHVVLGTYDHFIANYMVRGTRVRHSLYLYDTAIIVMIGISFINSGN